MLGRVLGPKVSHRLPSGCRPGLQAREQAPPREAALASSFTGCGPASGSCGPLARGLPLPLATSPVHRAAHDVTAGSHQNEKEGARWK